MPLPKRVHLTRRIHQRQTLKSESQGNALRACIYVHLRKNSTVNFHTGSDCSYLVPGK